MSHESLADCLDLVCTMVRAPSPLVHIASLAVQVCSPFFSSQQQTSCVKRSIMSLKERDVLKKLIVLV